MPRPTLSLISLPDLSKIFTCGLSMPSGGKPKVLPEMATQTLSLLSTVIEVIVSRPAANTPTLYPAATLILLGSGVTGVRVDHLPAGPPGSAFARSCAKADPDAAPTANASIAAYLSIFISFSSSVEIPLPTCRTTHTNHFRAFAIPLPAGPTRLRDVDWSDSERADVCDDPPDVIVAQPFLPRVHGRDLFHIGASLLDDQH